MRHLLSAALAMALVFVSCNNEDGDHDGGGKQDYGPAPDQPACKRPPNIQSCTAPGLEVCPTTVLCLGCQCSGPNSVYACNGFTWDCRWFCTGCYPADYTLCDKNASKAILGICGYCNNDSGPPGKCNVAFREAGVYPDVGQPDVGQPDVGQPDMAKPDMAKPDMAKPDMAKPDKK